MHECLYEVVRTTTGAALRFCARTRLWGQSAAGDLQQIDRTDANVAGRAAPSARTRIRRNADAR